METRVARVLALFMSFRDHILNKYTRSSMLNSDRVDMIRSKPHLATSCSMETRVARVLALLMSFRDHILDKYTRSSMLNSDRVDMIRSNLTWRSFAIGRRVWREFRFVRLGIDAQHRIATRLRNGGACGVCLGGHV